MNQYHDSQFFRFSPDSSATALAATLTRLLVPGNIMDSCLNSYCRRIQERFAILCSTCPSPQWHKGLIITPEIRCQTELYLPVKEIQAAFRYLLLRSCRYSPFFPAVPIFSALSWADALERINQPCLSYNPARIIAEVSVDQELRKKFLAALFIPQRFGGGFNRYPLQKIYLKEWFSGRNKKGISVLDAACGSGEGVYELAIMIAAAGFHPESAFVHGCTIEPLELAAAAHGWFPEDSGRELSVTRMIESASKRGCPEAISFFREDICRPLENSALYDVVICNGLLGGPLLHEHARLEAAVKALVGRVTKGGLLLAADRFHDGWRRVVPLDELKLLFVKYGIRLVDLPEGVGGIRT